MSSYLDPEEAQAACTPLCKMHACTLRSSSNTLLAEATPPQPAEPECYLTETPSLEGSDVTCTPLCRMHTP